MAIERIDHVVVIGEDLGDLVERYRALGFTVTPGGSHAGTQTHNALIPFDDGSYIELLAFQGSARDGRRAELLARGGGLVEYMLASNAIEIDLANARRHRLPYGTPVAGSRIRPDGIEVAWIDGPLIEPGAGLPYLIQDVTARDLRVPSGDARRHPNGATGIATLVAAVANVESAALLYQHLLGDDAESAQLTREFVEAVFLIGPHRVSLRQPLDFGPLNRHLERHGDSPFALVLRGSSPRSFDPADTAGVRLSIEP